MPRTAASVPVKDRLQFWAIRGLMGVVLALPYRLRVPVMGWIVAHAVAPVLGWRRRIRANLALVCRDLPPAEVRRMTRAVPDNWGRTLIEIFSGEEFGARVADAPLGGPGLAAFRQARAEGRRVILVTGHFGNYDAVRGALHRQGHPMAALYREMRIAPFSDWYVSRIAAVAAPVYPSTRQGLVGFLRHLRDEGMVGILIDLHAYSGAPVTFFGQTAQTSTSAAEWALKYEAELFPVYARRRSDGLTFELIVDTPVPHADPVAMTQALNDSLERVVRGDMDQWFWIHRRWKAAAPDAPQP